MILTGVQPSDVAGVAADLNVLGYDDYADDAEGIGYEYDLLDGKQKTLRKGVRNEVVRISGRAYLNVRGAPSGWDDPQGDLENLRLLRGALVNLNNSAESGTGSLVGRYQLRSASIRRRHRRGATDDFMSVAWEIELVASEALPTGGAGGDDE